MWVYACREPSELATIVVFPSQLKGSSECWEGSEGFGVIWFSAFFFFFPRRQRSYWIGSITFHLHQGNKGASEGASAVVLYHKHTRNCDADKQTDSRRLAAFHRLIRLCVCVCARTCVCLCACFCTQLHVFCVHTLFNSVYLRWCLCRSFLCFVAGASRSLLAFFSFFFLEMKHSESDKSKVVGVFVSYRWSAAAGTPLHTVNTKLAPF